MCLTLLLAAGCAGPQLRRRGRDDSEEDGGDPLHLQEQGGGQAGRRGESSSKGR